MVDIEDLAPVPSVRERDIDLLVAHLTSTSTEFVRWLLDAARPWARARSETSNGSAASSV